jgi:uncharacterized protein
MAETLDELSAPLGLNTAVRKRRARLPFTAMQALALLLGLCLVAFVSVTGFNKHFLGNEPVTGMIPKSERSGELRGSKDETGTSSQAAPSQTVTFIDGSNGARHEVAIGTSDHTDR